jgi:hypothetical protein
MNDIAKIPTVVLTGFLGVTGSLGVEPQIQVRIAKLVPAFSSFALRALADKPSFALQALADKLSVAFQALADKPSFALGGQAEHEIIDK